MPLIDSEEREIVECIKQKDTPTKFGAMAYRTLIVGSRYIMPRTLAKELVKEGYVHILVGDLL